VVDELGVDCSTFENQTLFAHSDDFGGLGNAPPATILASSGHCEDAGSEALRFKVRFLSQFSALSEINWVGVETAFIRAGRDSDSGRPHIERFDLTRERA